MRLSALTALLAGAGIVAAVPIRVIVVSSNATPQEGHPLDNVRFGHGVQHPPTVAKITMSTGALNVSTPNMRRPCGERMSRFRQKGIEISNAFRAALGLPLIEPNAHLAPNKANEFRIQPINPEHPFKNHPYVKWFNPVVAQDMIQGSIQPEPAHHHVGPHHGGPHHGGPHHRFHHNFGHRGSLLTRLHYSLMNLGLWEGRAVAFVLGCGIGVLLRMFWVLAIVAYRIIKRRPQDEDDYTHITIFEEVEVAPPPHYTYPIDEKVAIDSETKVAEPAVAVAAEETK